MESGRLDGSAERGRLESAVSNGRYNSNMSVGEDLTESIGDRIVLVTGAGQPGNKIRSNAGGSSGGQIPSQS